MNEPLDASGFWSRAAKGIPEVLPGFMRFPVVAGVEEVEGIEPGRVGGEKGGESVAPGGWIGRQLGDYVWWVLAVEGVAAGIVHRMRQVMAGNVAVGWQREHGDEARRCGRRVHVANVNAVTSDRASKDINDRQDDTGQPCTQPTTDQEDASTETEERHDDTEDRKRVSNVSRENVG